ncbi:MAG: glycosyltransferase family 2 protein [Candidatus Omnitrophica bacterium]|nr:glycosyltransferase family 2 protein [Candidatus Omnitrophota bacterium]
MKVGIIILSWNSKGFIGNCLDGLLKFETSKIYVVDNNSTDGSVDYIARDYPEVALIRSVSNLGFAAGNNVGIECALKEGCEAVFLINNDTIIDEPLVPSCVKILEDDPSVGVVGPVIVEADNPEVIQSAGGRISLWNLNFPYIKKGKRYLRSDHIEAVSYVLGAAMLIRKSVIEKNEGFDPEYYPAYVEEADFCYRAFLSGYKNMVYYGSRVRHIGSKSSGGRENAFRRMMVNRFLFGIKHLGFFRFFLASQFIVLRVMIKKLIRR